MNAPFCLRVSTCPRKANGSAVFHHYHSFSRENKMNFNYSLIGFLVASLLLISPFYYLNGNNSSSRTMRFDDDQTKSTRSSSFSRCNLFSGKWAYDNISYYPMYKEGQCTYMLDDYACEKFGRKEFKYQHWRWQPHDCDLPRFNATALLEKLRGKRLVYVGDSLNKNQWMSMVCLLESSIPPALKSYTNKGSFFTFKAFEYNASISFYWEPLLVESNCDDPLRVNHHIHNRTVRIMAIEKHARQWSDADILIFDSFMWWLDTHINLLWGSFGDPDGIYKTLWERETLRALEMGLRTWSDWLEMHINRTKTKLFFMSLSPYHIYPKDWGSPEDEKCINETEPIFDQGYWGSTTDREMMHIVEASLHDLERRGLKVEYLNITQLSDYRKDAHLSIYRMQTPTKEQLANPKSYADCLHWCLPGVPDVWNEILYAYIMFH